MAQRPFLFTVVVALLAAAGCGLLVEDPRRFRARDIGPDALPEDALLPDMRPLEDRFILGDIAPADAGMR